MTTVLTVVWTTPEVELVVPVDPVVMVMLEDLVHPTLVMLVLVSTVMQVLQVKLESTIKIIFKTADVDWSLI